MFLILYYSPPPSRNLRSFTAEYIIHVLILKIFWSFHTQKHQCSVKYCKTRYLIPIDIVAPQYNYIQVGVLRRGRCKSDVIVTSSRSEKLVNIWFTSFILIFACSNILTDIKHMRKTTFYAVFWSYTEI